MRVCRECELKYKHTYYPDKEKKRKPGTDFELDLLIVTISISIARNLSAKDCTTTRRQIKKNEWCSLRHYFDESENRSNSNREKREENGGPRYLKPHQVRHH